MAEGHEYPRSLRTDVTANEEWEIGRASRERVIRKLGSCREVGAGRGARIALDPPSGLRSRIRVPSRGG